MQINRTGKFLVNQLKHLATTRKISCRAVSCKQNRGASLGPQSTRWSCTFEQTSAPTRSLNLSHCQRVDCYSERKQWIIRHAPQQQAAPRLRPSDCLAINQIEQQKRICISRLTLNIYLLFRATPTTWLMWSARARALITHSQCSTTHLTSRSDRKRAYKRPWIEQAFVLYNDIENMC
jgi:hypothetical protein